MGAKGGQSKNDGVGSIPTVPLKKEKEEGKKNPLDLILDSKIHS